MLEDKITTKDRDIQWVKIDVCYTNEKSDGNVQGKNDSSPGFEKDDIDDLLSDD